MISFIDMPQLVVESANLLDLTARLLISLGIIPENQLSIVGVIIIVCMYSYNYANNTT